MCKNQLQFESPSGARLLIECYHPDRDEWDFSRDSDFWHAVQEAHKWGRRGEGKRIAIIDGAFDLAIPKLRAQANGTINAWAASGESKDHGTGVALLIGAVAPSCHFDLYEVSQNQKPSRSLVIKALELASQSDAILINLSIGRPVDNLGWWDRLWRPKGHCELCRCASMAAAGGKLVIAAVGNAEGEAFCPARDKSALGIGFQREVRKVIKTKEGGFSEAAFWDKPSYPQAFIPDYTVAQPAGVLGSSFAAPLITGALALIDDIGEVHQFLEAAEIGSIADAMQGVLKNFGPAKGMEMLKLLYVGALSLPHKHGGVQAALHNAGASEGIDMLKKLYAEALLRLPHRHSGAQDGPPCIACSIFAQNLYINAGLFFLEYGGLIDLSEDLLVAARWLAPWSPHAAANLATVQRIRAASLLKQVGKTTTVAGLLHDAKDNYLYALKIRPNCEIYLSGIRIVDNLLSDCSDICGQKDDTKTPTS